MATQQDGAAAAELIGMLKLASFDGLQKKRTSCPNCSKSQKHYCCDCLQLLPSYQGPKVQLPIKLDVIHHIQEKRSKSSAVHAAVLAADDTKFIDYNPSMPVIPEYDPSCTLLLFPCDEAKRLSDIDLSVITRVVVVDSTWSQSKIILEHTSLQLLPKVELESHATIFWRYQDVPNQ
jgi:DTW domain-containing protein YfiP